eukprot:1181200-Prorocentrum_minimum.AAC.2
MDTTQGFAPQLGLNMVNSRVMRWLNKVLTVSSIVSVSTPSLNWLLDTESHYTLLGAQHGHEWRPQTLEFSKVAPVYVCSLTRLGALALEGVGAHSRGEHKLVDVKRHQPIGAQPPAGEGVHESCNQSQVRSVNIPNLDFL